MIDVHILDIARIEIVSGIWPPSFIVRIAPVELVQLGLFALNKKYVVSLFLQIILTVLNGFLQLIDLIFKEYASFLELSDFLFHLFYFFAFLS